MLDYIENLGVTVV